MASSSRLKYRPNSPKAILMLLLIFGVAIIGISASGFHYTINTVAGASSSVTFDWSQARGVDYRWSAVPGQGSTFPIPSVSFPEMVSLGFNMITVPIFWYGISDSGYLTELQSIASEADSVGLAVVYALYYAQSLSTVPSNVASASGASSDSRYTAYYFADNFNVNGQSVWAYQMSTFWQPVIQALDSYPSTVGYSIGPNEPKAASNAIMQTYNTYFATAMRGLTQKALLIRSLNYDYYPGSVDPPLSLGILLRWFTGIVLRLLVVQIQLRYFRWATIGKADGTPILLGEWGTCVSGSCSDTEANIDTQMQTWITEFKEYGFASNWWAWSLVLALVVQTSRICSMPMETLGSFPLI